MHAEIITIGDEILIGQIVDSNSAFLAKELNKIGIEVSQIKSISDKEDAILDAMKDAQNRVSLVVLTGGLGPTKDDITKSSFCSFFNDKLVHSQEVLDHIEALFAQYLNVPINDLNRAQAMVPSNATLLENRFGTAVGMWMENDDTVYVSLPGVPYEMKHITNNELIPKLKTHFKRPVIVHKTMMTYGWGESQISEVIQDWESNLPEHIKLAYLPNLGRVRLRSTGRGEDETVLTDQLDRLFTALEPLIGEIITVFDSEGSLEEQIAQKFIDKGLSLTTAESCTGGRIASQLTAVSGASKFFKGGLVTYETATKNYVLGISQEIIDTYSVVSAEITKEMAIKAKALFRTDYAIAISLVISALTTE
jgi:nicotinamide-nucleotide amidase